VESYSYNIIPTDCTSGDLTIGTKSYHFESPVISLKLYKNSILAASKTYEEFTTYPMLVTSYG
jgi:hypothetical protein